MAYKDILAAINIDTDFSKADRDAILGVIREAYRESSVARDMFDTWVIDKGRDIDFIFNAGDFSAWNGKVWLDMNELDHASYIDSHGNAVQDYPFTAIIHELGHALTGRLDNWTPEEPAGENQIFANRIYRQTGYTEQLAYMAYDASGDIIERGIDYTDGHRIDSAWVHKWSDLPDNYDTTHGGTFTLPYRDLVIGSADANVLKTGNGGDFVYGLAGDDTLRGGNGIDRLSGGIGKDLLDGGSGLDFASYKLAAAKVTADLADPGNNTGEANGDEYASIAGLIGSAFGDDLTGNGKDNFIEGRDGRDSITGAGGNDRLDGGRGSDSAIFLGAYAGYDIDLDKGTVSGGGEGRDHLSHIEFAVFSDGVLDLQTGAFSAGMAGTDYLI